MKGNLVCWTWNHLKALWKNDWRERWCLQRTVKRPLQHPWKKGGKSSIVISDANGNKQIGIDIRNFFQSKMTGRGDRLAVVSTGKVVEIWKLDFRLKKLVAWLFIIAILQFNIALFIDINKIWRLTFSNLG